MTERVQSSGNGQELEDSKKAEGEVEHQPRAEADTSLWRRTVARAGDVETVAGAVLAIAAVIALLFGIVRFGGSDEFVEVVGPPSSTQTLAETRTPSTSTEQPGTSGGSSDRAATAAVIVPNRLRLLDIGYAVVELEPGESVLWSFGGMEYSTEWIWLRANFVGTLELTMEITDDAGSSENSFFLDIADVSAGETACQVFRGVVTGLPNARILDQGEKPSSNVCLLSIAGSTVSVAEHFGTSSAARDAAIRFKARQLETLADGTIVKTSLGERTWFRSLEASGTEDELRAVEVSTEDGDFPDDLALEILDWLAES